MQHAKTQQNRAKHKRETMHFKAQQGTRRMT